MDEDLMREGDTGEAILPVPPAERDGSERELIQYLSADVSELTRSSETERLRQGLWDVWAALGHDTDGDTGPGALISGMGVDGFIAMVLRDAQTWRRETEEDYDNDTSRLEAEVARWREKAQEAGAAYANANTKHHAEWERANRLEGMAERLAERAVELEDQAQKAEAALARVEAALDVIDEVAYFQISLEKMLTVMMTGPNRAQVPTHWRDDVEARAALFRGHIEAALAEPEVTDV